MTRLAMILAGGLGILGMAPAAHGQSLGTFRWQLQPFCNVVTLAVTESGGVFQLDGTDDQCGNGADQASAIGTAFQNPDGTIGFGLTIVVTPGGAPVHVDAAIALASLNGTWRDSAGNSGAFALTPGPGSGGPVRPVPTPVVPPAIQLRADGGFLAGGTANVGTIPTSGPGIRMMWHPGKGAFRAGEVTSLTPGAWDDPNVGASSTALGDDTIASGFASLATGQLTTASGDHSTALGLDTRAIGASATAMGQSNTASGNSATAMGSSTTASGFVSTTLGLRTTASGSNATAMGASTIASEAASTAMGIETTASGTASTAMGIETTASGTASTAMGSETTASGLAATAMGQQAVAGGSASLAAGALVSAAGDASVALGSAVSASTSGTFMFGDLSSGSPMLTFEPNQFLVRASGGVGFYSNSTLTAGVTLAAGAGAWASVSDVNRKQHFRDLSGEDVLAKLARMSIQEWSYKAQDPSIRHVGPTAQQFHAAFGLGEDPLRISTIDADGIALRAIQALEDRDRQTSAAQLAVIEMLRAEVADLKRQLSAGGQR